MRSVLVFFSRQCGKTKTNIWERCSTISFVALLRHTLISATLDAIVHKRPCNSTHSHGFAKEFSRRRQRHFTFRRFRRASLRPRAKVAPNSIGSFLKTLVGSARLIACWSRNTGSSKFGRLNSSNRTRSARTSPRLPLCLSSTAAHLPSEHESWNWPKNLRVPKYSEIGSKEPSLSRLSWETASGVRQC